MSYQDDQPPAKRLRISGLDGADDETMEDAPAAKVEDVKKHDVQADKEVQSGIIAFVNSDSPGFVGILKQRYTDFQVHEILPNGTALHLLNTQPPKRKIAPAARSDEELRGKRPQTKHARNYVTAAANLLDESLKPEPTGDSSSSPAIGLAPVSDEASSTAIKSNERSNKKGVLITATKAEKSEEGAGASTTDAKPEIVKDNIEAPNENANPSAPEVPIAVEPPPQTEAKLEPNDADTLRELFGQVCLDDVLGLYQSVLRSPDRKSSSFPSVLSGVITDRQARTTAHQAVRRIFNGKLETETNDDNLIKFTAAPPKGNRSNWNTPRQQPRQNQVRGKLGWDDFGGEYLHFTLYKENKDTMESIYFLAQQTKMNVKNFDFGGTKDRRAVTVQRASCRRIHADALASAGRRLRNAAIGDYEYRPKGLELGELAGNEFCISLRDCHFPGEDGMTIDDRVKLAEQTLAQTVPSFDRDGFLNYYGLQRFGSFSMGTDLVGTKILQGDLKGAVEAILHFSQSSLDAANDESSTVMVSADDKGRAGAIDIWNRTGNAIKAVDRMPRKFSAESNIIRFLGSHNIDRSNDYQGALMTISRPLRLMYVHAYQSLVWNHVVSERWRLYGSKVVEGDLVVIDPKDEAASGDQRDVDDSGEPIVRPEKDDAAADPEDAYTRARPLSTGEASSGKYTVFDLVLPLPGYDVIYPKNGCENVYKTFMASERGGGLNPNDMRRSFKDASLSGGYRKFLARPKASVSWEVKTYMHDEEQLAETDLDRLEKKKRANRGEEPLVIQKSESDEVKIPDKAKIAVILRMQLGPSTYATMALRELMGSGGVKTYKPDYGSGRN